MIHKKVPSTILMVLVMVWFYTVDCIGQEEMDADRPNQTYSPQTVSKGSVQIETGFQFHRTKHSNSRTDSLLFPTTAVRVGIANNFEVRIFDQAIRQRQSENGEIKRDVTGIDNIRIGAKAKLWDQRGVLPEFGVLAYAALPTGGDFRNHHVLPEFRLLFLNEINKRIGISYNVGWEGDNELEKGIGIYTVVLQFELTNKLKIFAEHFGEFENLEKMSPTVDTEVMYLLLPNFQLDASIGKNLSEAHHYFDVGFTLRLPK